MKEYRAEIMPHSSVYHPLRVNFIEVGKAYPAYPWSQECETYSFATSFRDARRIAQRGLKTLRAADKFNQEYKKVTLT